MSSDLGDVGASEPRHRLVSWGQSRDPGDAKGADVVELSASAEGSAETGAAGGAPGPGAQRWSLPAGAQPPVPRRKPPGRRGPNEPGAPTGLGASVSCRPEWEVPSAVSRLSGGFRSAPGPRPGLPQTTGPAPQKQLQKSSQNQLRECDAPSPAPDGVTATMSGIQLKITTRGKKWENTIHNWDQSDQ